MTPLNHILRKCTGGYTLHKLRENHQGSSAHGRNKTVCQKWKELETLILAERIYYEDIGIEFRIEKWAMLLMGSEKRQMMEGIQLPNREEIWKFGEKETYEYLEILKADIIKEVEMKEKKRVSQTNEKISRKYSLLQESHKRDEYLICLLLRYSGPFLKWMKVELY